MAFNLTTFDQQLAKGQSLIIDGMTPIGGFPPGGEKIVFQFPPVISSETKNQQWKTIWQTMAWDPLYIWKGGNPRKITLAATYIVGGPGREGVRWTPARVSTELRRYKSYFYNDGLGDANLLPIFTLDLYEHAPGSDGNAVTPTLWRGLSVNLKYSDALIGDPENGVPKSVFPLRSDVTLVLEQASNIKFDDDKRIYAFKNLEDTPPQTWY